MKLLRRREQEPTNSYAAQTYASGFWPRRFAHGARFRAARELARPPGGATVVDFGCGDGRFGLDLARDRPDLSVVAWDPFAKHREIVRETAAAEDADVVVPESLGEIEPGSAATVFCLDVMEHLPHGVVRLESAAIRELLGAGGTLIVSVPVEIGPPAVGKALLHRASGSSHNRLGTAEGNGSQIGEMLRLVVGRPRLHPERESLYSERGAYILSHAGFDHRRLLRLLEAEGWRRESTRTSPFPALPASVNSQVLWRLVP